MYEYITVIALDLMLMIHILQQSTKLSCNSCMNYIVSTYNNTLFTTAAAKFSATAAVAAPTEKAAEAAQRLTKIRQRFH